MDEAHDQPPQAARRDVVRRAMRPVPAQHVHAFALRLAEADLLEGPERQDGAEEGSRRPEARGPEKGNPCSRRQRRLPRFLRLPRPHPAPPRPLASGTFPVYTGRAMDRNARLRTNFGAKGGLQAWTMPVVRRIFSCV